ncbi:hypothetical protein ACVAMH_24690 [Bacillus zanthoxyli]
MRINEKHFAEEFLWHYDAPFVYVIAADEERAATLAVEKLKQWEGWNDRLAEGLRIECETEDTTVEFVTDVWGG